MIKHVDKIEQKSFCNIIVKDSLTFHITVTYEIFLFDIVLLVHEERPETALVNI